MLPQPVTPLMKWRSRFREMDEGLAPLQGNGGCVEGAVKGGRSPAKRTLEGPLNADTLQGLGLVADFRSRPPSPSGGEDFPALGGGVTVSYTHLDVYKRQGCACTVRVGILLRCGRLLR